MQLRKDISRYTVTLCLAACSVLPMSPLDSKGGGEDTGYKSTFSIQNVVLSFPLKKEEKKSRQHCPKVSELQDSVKGIQAA